MKTVYLWTIPTLTVTVKFLMVLLAAANHHLDWRGSSSKYTQQQSSQPSKLVNYYFPNLTGISSRLGGADGQCATRPPGGAAHSPRYLAGQTSSGLISTRNDKLSGLVGRWTLTSVWPEGIAVLWSLILSVWFEAGGKLWVVLAGPARSHPTQ